MARSILAVMIGYLTFGISAGLLFGISGVDPDVWPSTGFLAFSIFYGIAFATLGGYLAARIAPHAEARHGAIVGLIMAVIAMVTMIMKWGDSAPWTEIPVIVLMAPAAWIGGRIRAGSVGSGDRPSATK